MKGGQMRPLPLAAAACLLLADAPAGGQPASPPKDAGQLMLTVFLRHDQSKTLGEIRAHLEKEGFFQKFPPAGTEVVSWYVMMGVGQVVTLRFPAEKLREVNLALEQSAWGAFRTEFYPTYDYKPIAEAERKKARP
ncbi:MAG TPA: hypothetical protein VFE93_09920 [Myxococcaceae bacterium]|nr:hypothetical protein [Myxococcaceae bacterium]